MSLSAREQRALESIADGLAESDPRLDSLLGIFSRLAWGEDMPARDEIHPIRVTATGRPYRNRPRALCLRLGWNRAAVLLWLVMTIGLISVALALSNRGPGECAQSWGTVCTGSEQAHVARPGGGPSRGIDARGLPVLVLRTVADQSPKRNGQLGTG